MPDADGEAHDSHGQVYAWHEDLHALRRGSAYLQALNYIALPTSGGMSRASHGSLNIALVVVSLHVCFTDVLSSSPPPTPPPPKMQPCY